MEYDSNKPVNTRYTWGRGDKSLLLKIQMAISALLIFIGIVQATNVFLLNKAQDNPISFGIFVIIVLVVVLSGVTIVWAILTSKRLAMSEDLFTSTNTKFSQILLFLTLILFILYVVFFTLFKFSKTDLFNTA